jgi:hypothetical protein
MTDHAIILIQRVAIVVLFLVCLWAWCEQVHPWSFGVWDDTPALCDDCAVRLREVG